MTVSTIIFLFRLLVGVVQFAIEVKKAYNNLPPEQKEQAREAFEAWEKTLKDVQDPMGGPSDGSGP